ncbi:G-protein alpha subunit, putative [Trichomonas vaginalis G3]|uniref:G-protein alpha subunit, putative n=1 Tax=Trichomonas vaginalis (strain ATCC PRA-98 / G3) TaxID=412133 RepID=A2E5G0_TRIV3|nr:G-protein beta/gamma-subunit complex binding [Trichomonas vaginalis G3]EAY12121.1 G-protein alpha subunit, putative [Trichomonas vaginalis G3]KAI5542391.1 G-protein beta/gamma-subunit complex binding [Trichomonas vaginalis G3]|eukprot:XP_001324344.1 G-protein alpha subunit [Trichomonas vaginalis G3]
MGGCLSSDSDVPKSKPQPAPQPSSNQQAASGKGATKFAVPTGAPTKKINITPKRAVGVSNSADEDAFKICIVGAGESGKTTFTRNMVLNYLGGINDKDRRSEIVTIRGNMIDAIKDLIKFVQSEGLESELPDDEEEFIQNLLDVDAFDADFSELAAGLHKIWNCDVIQKAYYHTSQVVVPDNMDYFFEKYLEIAKEDYVPTDGDLLRVRVRTIGIKPMVFDLEGARFQLTDVGGQICERKNWQKVLEGTEAVIFAFSLAEFDRKMFEKPEELRIDDSIKLFEATVNGETCSECPIYLVGNKYEKFCKKIQETDAFGAAFPDFQGNIHDPLATSEYLFKLFKDKMVQNGSEYHTFQTFTMTAIDSQSVIKVAESVFEDLNRRFFCD